MNVINSEKKVFKKNLLGWNYFMSIKYLKDPKAFAGFGQYLFFHTNPDGLEKIARDEIENNGFDIAKIRAELSGKFTDYVMCLFYQDDSRKNELRGKHQGKNGIQFRGWKSDEDTRKGKYSKQYLDNL